MSQVCFDLSENWERIGTKNDHRFKNCFTWTWFVCHLFRWWIIHYRNPWRWNLKVNARTVKSQYNRMMLSARNAMSHWSGLGHRLLHSTRKYLYARPVKCLVVWKRNQRSSCQGVRVVDMTLKIKVFCDMNFVWWFILIILHGKQVSWAYSYEIFTLLVGDWFRFYFSCLPNINPQSKQYRDKIITWWNW